MQNQIPWTKYFDKIYCEFFLPNKNRFDRLDKELERVGIKQSPQFEYVFNTPSAFDAPILAHIQKKDHLNIFKPSYVNHLMQREGIFRRALNSGYERILVLEDDVAFLKDLSELDTIFRTMPDGFDFFQMDKFMSPKNRALWRLLVKSKRLNEHWIDSSSVRFTSAACMAYTRRGMETLLNVIETCPGSVDQLSAKITSRWATSIKNCTIQLVYGNAVNLTYKKIASLHALYDGFINYSEYNCPPGYPKEKICL